MAATIIMKLLIVILIIPVLTYGQTSISGRVSLCDDFDKSFSIKGHLTYNQSKKRKSKRNARSVDTLRVSIEAFKNETLEENHFTDIDGKFHFTLDNGYEYRIRFSINKLIYRDTLISVLGNEIPNMEVCLSDTTFHNFFLSKIPYDSIRAKEDIKNGTIQIVSLHGQGSGCSISILDYLDEDEITEIESNLGIKFHVEFIEYRMPTKYIHQRELEYNQVVYDYLDSTYNGNSHEIIMSTLMD